MDENVEYTKLSIRQVHALATTKNRMVVHYPAGQAISVITHKGWYVFFTTLTGTAYKPTEAKLSPLLLRRLPGILRRSYNETGYADSQQEAVAVDTAVSRLLHTPPSSPSARYNESSHIWILPKGCL